MAHINTTAVAVSAFMALAEPVAVMPSRNIAGFKFAAVVREDGTDEFEITQHPVQEGAKVSDHAYRKPAILTMDIVDLAGKFPRASSLLQSVKNIFSMVPGAIPPEIPTLQRKYELLLMLQNLRAPLKVVTGKRIYKNMLIQSLSVSTDKNTEHCLAIKIKLQEVIIVVVAATTLPARAVQKHAAKTGQTTNTGTKQAEAVGAPDNMQQSQLDALKEAGKKL